MNTHLGVHMSFRLLSLSLLSLFAGVFPAYAFVADNVDGQPVPWQYNFQDAATPVMERLIDMHDMLMIIITAVTLFVVGLLVWVCVRYNERVNPKPSKTAHNTMVEVVWTVVPVLILLVIVVPALKNLYFMDKATDADMTLKVVGHQWYWSYEYPDHGGFGFDSYMKAEEDLAPGELRLLEVDNRIVVPVDTTVRVLVTAADVIHNFAMPAFGLKMDAVPGRLNETWFHATRTGVFYGQCSELCGVRHGFMPIAIEVVEKPVFDAWVESAKEQFANTGDAGGVAPVKGLAQLQ